MNSKKIIQKKALQKIINPLLVIAIAMITYTLLPFGNTLHPISLDSIWDCSSEYSDKIVTVNVDSLYYTGYSVSHTFNRTYGYYYTISDDKCSFVLIPIKDTPKEKLKNYKLYGKVVHKSEIDSFSAMVKNLSTDLNWNVSGIYSYTPDFIICNNEYHPVFLPLALLLLIIGIIVSAIIILLSVIHIVIPKTYNFCPGVNTGIRKKILEDINTDFNDEYLFSDNHTVVTKNHVFIEDTHKVYYLPLDMLIWAYRMGKPSGLFFKKTNVKFSLFITLKNGKTIVVPGFSGDSSHLFLTVLKDLDRGIILGYTDEKSIAVKQYIQSNS
ncbi:MAG: hypothetical protein E7254_00120 [Lachnospiraceae bacterium]|nr:hypothetical protein [Lachnospiraceae bacterium]